MWRMLQAQARRLRGARTDGGAEPRPFPPGDYPVVVVGSGPGALQASYSLRPAGRRPRGHLGRPVARRHVPALAVLPAPPVVDQAARAGRARDAAPTSATTGTACSARSAERRALQPGLMDGTSYFPSRPEMEANLAPFAERAGVADPLRLPLDGDPSRSTAPDGDAVRRSRRPTASTAAGTLVLAVGVAEPYTPPGAGHGAHPPLRRRPAGRDVRGSSACSSSASRTPASSWRPASCRGRASSSSSSPSTAQAVGRHARRSSGSGRDTSSRTRTTSWAAGSASWTPRSTASSARPAAR